MCEKCNYEADSTWSGNHGGDDSSLGELDLIQKSYDDYSSRVLERNHPIDSDDDN